MKLNGKKTYIVCVLILAIAILGLFFGKFSSSEVVTLVSIAAGFAGIRSAIANS